jgi:hypothetical protein
MWTRSLTARQVAVLLQLDLESIYDLPGRGKLPATKIYGRWRYNVNEIHERFRAHHHAAESGKGASP